MALDYGLWSLSKTNPCNTLCQASSQFPIDESPSRSRSATIVPQYSTNSFNASSSFLTSSYNNYSDFSNNQVPSPEHGYQSSNSIRTVRRSHSRVKLDTHLDQLGSKFASALSYNQNYSSHPSTIKASSVEAGAKLIASTSGAMLARTTSLRLGGLLNRTTSSKDKPSGLAEELDMEESEDLPTYKPTLTTSPERSPKPGTPRSQIAIRPPPRNNRFSWFAGPTRQDTSVPSTPTDGAESTDPLLDLNIMATLFPDGQPDDASADSFHKLLRHASTLGERLQTGYRSKSILIKQANAERDAALEESDEASTRAQHLKLQLETMAAKTAENEKMIQKLSDQLRKATRTQEEQISELESLRMYRKAIEEERKGGTMPPPRSIEQLRSGSMSSVDESTPRRQRRIIPSGINTGSEARNSITSSCDGNSSDTASHNDSDVESCSFSVESASTLDGAITPATFYGQSLNISISQRPASPSTCFSPTSPVPGSNWSNPSQKKVVTSGTYLMNSGRTNTTPSIDVIGVLQKENQILKSRVSELEIAVEGCLILVA